MKKLLQSKYLLLAFLVTLCVINIVQGYFTELLADEAYYWMYSNFLDWGYFDHPPMVAVWISISKFFIASGELSVRFFSAITLSINFYLVWLLIQHPKKKEFVWLFILLLLSTALFNIYGFITVPDTPLLLFMSLFLLGYQKYLQQKSLLSYVLLAISMAGMVYSKYQAVLIIFFVILSNLKLLTDYKLWITCLVALLLFSPHLYWQYSNDYPSFRYHLFERSVKKYRIDFTTNHFLNLIAIIGFTFPIVYWAFFKNLKNKDLFQKALNYIVIGFVIFFFFSSFKDHVQAQWVVPISIPLIVITFHFLADNQQRIKLFKRLAFVSISVIFVLRILMTNGSLLPRELEMHNNKKWVARLEKTIGNKEPIFLNSYQNTSLYWFYSKNRPFQYNTWWSRKNHYDLLKYNQKIETDNGILVGVGKNSNPTDSVLMKNNGLIYLKDLHSYTLDKNNRFEISSKGTIKNNKKNTINITKESVKDFNIKIIDFYVVLKPKNKHHQIVSAKLINDNTLEFLCPNYSAEFTTIAVQVAGSTHKDMYPLRLSKYIELKFTK